MVFVLDRSGSMVGVKMKQMKDAMKTILDDLDDGDYVRWVGSSCSKLKYMLEDLDEEDIVLVYTC